MDEIFKIIKGVLEKYNGTEEHVVIPKGVKEIDSDAFSNNSIIKSVTIPEGVTMIDFHAFYNCSNLRSVTIPKSMQIVDEFAFYELPNLSNITVLTNRRILHYSSLDDSIMDRLIESLYPYIETDVLLHYIIDNWKNLSPKLKADIYLNTERGSFINVYAYCISWNEKEELATLMLKKLDTENTEDYCVAAGRFVMRFEPSFSDGVIQKMQDKLETLGTVILQNLEEDNSENRCIAAAKFVMEFESKLSDQLIQNIYDKLKSLGNGIRAARIVEDDLPVVKRIKISNELPVTESGHQLISLVLADKKKSNIKAALKKEYNLKITDLPGLLDKEGGFTDWTVLAWLLILGRQERRGISKEEEQIIALLDEASLMKALKTLAEENLGGSIRSKKMLLSYPICRFANEDLLSELTKMAPKWRTRSSGNNGPCLKIFRDAILYNDSQTAMLFADRYGDLGQYAKLRRMKENKLRDFHLSDVGLTADGRKSYDLGNQVVTVKMQKDFSFIVELPENGKTVKSLPKKGSDPSKYEAAKKHFSKLKKSVKKTAKNRIDLLFREFLDEKDMSVSAWKKVYLGNPTLRIVASLLVWKHEDTTFTVADSAIIDQNGNSTKLLRGRITLAHPMDMNETEIEAWQDYFANRGLKQPFAQVWEPVRNPDEIKKDRYTGCCIPFYRFRDKEKHGIKVERINSEEGIQITFEDCKAYVEQIIWRRDAIYNDDPFEIKSFSFWEYTKKVNHIVAYLDQITLYERIRKDDISAVGNLKGLTLAQILECIETANKSGSKNCLAALLQAKHDRWPEYSEINSLLLDEM